MFKLRFSMRFTLGATILLMGLLGLALALVTGEIYRRQTLENQRSALNELIQISVDAQLTTLKEKARDLVLTLQGEPAFRRALAGGRRTLLERLLLDRLHRNSATASNINPGQLRVYDQQFHLLGAARAGASERDAACPAVLAQAQKRTGAAPLDVLAGLCLNDNLVRYAVLVPGGSLMPAGYVEVIYDPVPWLTSIESRLGFPLRIRDAQGRRIFTSATWPAPDTMQNTLVAEYVLTAASGEPALRIAVLRNVELLQRGIANTRWLVMALAIGATLLGVIIALYILEKTTLQPLNSLAEQLRRIGNNKDHLGEQVDTGGIAEIRALGDDFNQMSLELDRLYGSLEHLAFTDPLTNLPNRARFRDTLQEAIRQYTQAHQPFALLLTDLDRFKAVNDTLGHQGGDLLLQEVSSRLRSVLRESDTVARLDNAAIAGLEGKMVARLGGDEFAAILPRVATIDDASAVARKLLLSMQEPFLIRGHSVSIGISIGIALYPQHGNDIETLMQRADSAMYFAKNNQCGMAFPDTMQQEELI